MALIQQYEENNSVVPVATFGGLNTTRHCSIAEFSKTKNLNCDEFPLLQSDDKARKTNDKTPNGGEILLVADTDEYRVTVAYYDGTIPGYSVGTKVFTSGSEGLSSLIANNKIKISDYAIIGKHIVVAYGGGGIKTIADILVSGTVPNVKIAKYTYTASYVGSTTQIAGWARLYYTTGQSVYRMSYWQNDSTYRGTSEELAEACKTFTEFSFVNGELVYCTGDDTFVKVKVIYNSQTKLYEMSVTRVDELYMYIVLPKTAIDNFSKDEYIDFTCGVPYTASRNTYNIKNAKILDIWKADSSAWSGITEPYAMQISLKKSHGLNSDLQALFNYGHTQPDGHTLASTTKIYMDSVTVFRSAPSLNFVVGINNRVWGYSENDHSFYASALGNYKSYYSYDGTSQDSYAVELGESGNITGMGIYDGSPILFSENKMTRVYGNKPSNYQTQVMDAPGVKNGSADSIVQINGSLYYHSPNGIYVYNGGYPRSIADDIFSKDWTDGKGGYYKDNYYLAVKDGERHRLFVYDTIKKIWHEKDCGVINRICNLSNGLAIIESDCVRYIPYENELNTEDYNKGEYSAETFDLFGDTLDKKYLKQIRISAELEESSELRAYVEYDRNGRWEQVATVQVPKRQIWKKTIQNIKRADTYRLKLEGKGKVHIYGIEYTLEVCEE